MKKILFILAIVYCFSIPHTMSQINLEDIIGAAKDGFGKSVDAGEETADKKVVDDLNDKITKKLDDPKLKMLMGNFSEALKKFSNESKTGKCLQIMGAYAEVLAYCDMKAETETDPCKKKDWLGIESMVLFAGTAINYCPQEFYGLSNDGSVDHDASYKYEFKILKYFFGDSLDDFNKLLGFSKDATDLILSISQKYLKDKGKNSYSELSQEDKEAYNIWLLKQLDGYKRHVEYELPHVALYYKFISANEQLGLLNDLIEKDNITLDLVGKMFTPEFQIKKTLEIANENGKLKCIPK